MDVENRDQSPDLDVYVVNLHPSTIEADNIPSNYDEVKDRNNDIIWRKNLLRTILNFSYIRLCYFYQGSKISCPKSYKRR
jgi:hypothetical protein